MRADLHDLPPAFVAVAEYAILAGCNHDFATKLSAAGGDVTLVSYAERDYMGGYCYLNNAAVAAQYAAQAGQGPVAILDVDYHHGNGTQDIFYDSGDIFFA